MNAVVEIPVWLAILGSMGVAVAALDRVIAPSMRWYFRRRLERAVAQLNERLSLRIQPFKLMRRSFLIDRLTHDPEVMRALEDHVAETGMPRDIAIRLVEEYAKEITPSFSALVYFAVGARISRWIVNALYRVRLGAFDREALSRIDPEASVVFVINHKSNVDYLLVTHLASQVATLSYAVGEWARVWPLSRLFRAMGAYFIRRRDRDALYRTVLRRYVQMSVEGGVAQAIFPEGGLSRDGALAAPKLGLLSYVVEGFDPKGPRDVIFVPVGVNYDRVLEDRILLRATGEHGAGRFNVSLWTGFAFAVRYVVGRILGRSHRFGYACVSFGAPLSLRAFLEGRAEQAAVGDLGEALVDRIGAVVPVLPVSLIATILIEAEGPLTGPALEAAALARADLLRGRGAHLHIPRADIAYGVEVGLRMLTLRHIVEETPAGFVAGNRDEELLRFYANSIRHLEGAALAPAAQTS